MQLKSIFCILTLLPALFSGCVQETEDNRTMQFPPLEESFEFRLSIGGENVSYSFGRAQILNPFTFELEDGFSLRASDYRAMLPPAVFDACMETVWRQYAKGEHFTALSESPDYWPWLSLAGQELVLGKPKEWNGHTYHFFQKAGENVLVVDEGTWKHLEFKWIPNSRPIPKFSGFHLPTIEVSDFETKPGSEKIPACESPRPRPIQESYRNSTRMGFPYDIKLETPLNVSRELLLENPNPDWQAFKVLNPEWLIVDHTFALNSWIFSINSGSETWQISCGPNQTSSCGPMVSVEHQPAFFEGGSNPQHAVEWAIKNFDVSSVHLTSEELAFIQRGHSAPSFWWNHQEGHAMYLSREPYQLPHP